MTSYCGDFVEDDEVGSEAGTKILWPLVGVVGVLPGLTSKAGDTAVRVAARLVGRKVEVQEVFLKRTPVGDVEDWCRSYGEDFERAYPVEGEFGLEGGGVRAFRGVLLDGGSSVADQCPIVGGEWEESAQGVQAGGVPVV